jgi:hypothetical protein
VIAFDQVLLDRPQSAEIQLDLNGDYKTNFGPFAEAGLRGVASPDFQSRAEHGKWRLA